MTNQLFEYDYVEPNGNYYHCAWLVNFGPWAEDELSAIISIDFDAGIITEYDDERENIVKRHGILFCPYEPIELPHDTEISDEIPF